MRQSSLSVTPDPKGPLVDGSPAHHVNLITACDASHDPFTLRYEAVPAAQIALCARVLLKTHRYGAPECRCCAALERRYSRDALPSLTAAVPSP